MRIKGKDETVNLRVTFFKNPLNSNFDFFTSAEPYELAGKKSPHKETIHPDTN